MQNATDGPGPRRPVRRGCRWALAMVSRHATCCDMPSRLRRRYTTFLVSVTPERSRGRAADAVVYAVMKPGPEEALEAVRALAEPRAVLAIVGSLSTRIAKALKLKPDEARAGRVRGVVFAPVRGRVVARGRSGRGGSGGAGAQLAGCVRGHCRERARELGQAEVVGTQRAVSIADVAGRVVAVAAALEVAVQGG